MEEKKISYYQQNKVKILQKQKAYYRKNKSNNKLKRSDDDSHPNYFCILRKEVTLFSD